MRVKSYKEAVNLARSAGEDAANRRMRKAGRKAWTAEDHTHGARVTQQLLGDLGFDVSGWIATAGVARNEPEVVRPLKKRRRSKAERPVQLSLAF